MVARPRHIRFNLRMWAFVILPRAKVWAGAYILHVLSR